MSAYSNAVKEYIERYQREKGDESGLLDAHELAAWAYKNGLHKPNAKTIIDAIAADIAQVFREEYRTDRHGRRYRAKHATTKKEGNKTLSLWADLDDPNAPHEHFQRSFAQRRLQIVGDCFQLKTDVDVYNDQRQPEKPIQVVLDFSDDVEELQLRNNKRAA
ncbi:hypothetical protein ACLQ9J_08375 [Bordetella hinzii]|uniref:hypothetical protein n=1 Tax=Alcaligenaceae TaxID=506 RepID=UPI0009EA05D0|nr:MULTISPECIES: hypothetical protein [Achromobacter]PWY49194.1 hypothetical protein DK459_11760 [Achromobacter sp. RW408]WNO49122.1 hypothetical protein [Achromobacter phage CF418P1]CUR74776.1 hypothetical protein BN2905_36530 [Achromobacter xylosoxidans]